jgi:hypothetical protein
MHENFDYRPNPAYDPTKPLGVAGNFPDEIDPTRGLAQKIAERVTLPLLRERPIAEALRVIALHRLAPPEWLAERMLNELKPRANAPTMDGIFAAVTAMNNRKADAARAGTTLNLDALAEDLGMSPATLDRCIAQYKAWLAVAAGHAV